jgi:hypothetical protein
MKSEAVPGMGVTVEMVCATFDESEIRKKDWKYVLN